jgi:heme A synthase
MAHKSNSSKQKFLSKAATFFVIFQGTLGGLTVILKISPLMSTAHLVTSQIFLSIIWVALLLEIYAKNLPSSGALLPVSQNFKWAPALITFTLLQIGLGAFIRHSGASVSCGLGPDALWTCVDANDQLNKFWPTNLPGQFNMLHRFLGIALMFAIIAGTMPTLKWAKKMGHTKIRVSNISIHALILVQVVLGFATLYTGIDILMVTAHLLVAMLIWLSLWNLWALCATHEKSFSSSSEASPVCAN